MNRRKHHMRARRWRTEPARVYRTVIFGIPTLIRSRYHRPRPPYRVDVDGATWTIWANVLFARPSQ